MENLPDVEKVVVAYLDSERMERVLKKLVFHIDNSDFLNRYKEIKSYEHYIQSAQNNIHR